MAVRLSSDDPQPSLHPTTAAAGSRLLYLHTVRPMTIGLSILDASGRICWRRTSSISQGDNVLQLSFPALSAGIYYLSVTGDAGLIKTIPFSD